MGIISACQISCRLLPANVSVIGKAGSAACLTAVLAWASRVPSARLKRVETAATSEVTVTGYMLKAQCLLGAALLYDCPSNF